MILIPLYSGIQESSKINQSTASGKIKLYTILWLTDLIYSPDAQPFYCYLSSTGQGRKCDKRLMCQENSEITQLLPSWAKRNQTGKISRIDFQLKRIG